LAGGGLVGGRKRMVELSDEAAGKKEEATEKE
jgi:hypothetical protein